MTINPLQTGTDNPLVGAAWSLTLLQGAPILPDSAITARFGADGVVSGSGGCNRYRASYQVDGSSMTIGAAAGTLMACPPLLMDQERAYLAALQTAVAYRIEGRALEMRTADGALAVKLRRAARPHRR